MAEGHESLGGSGGMLLRKMFENDVVRFRANTERKNIFHFCSVSVQIWNYVSDPPMDYARKGECTDTRK